MKFEDINEAYYGGPGEHTTHVSSLQDYLEKMSNDASWISETKGDQVAVLEYPGNKWFIYLDGHQKTFDSPRDVIDFLIKRL